MKKGIIFGIGVSILIIGIVVGIGARSTHGGLPGIGGLPNSDDNEMTMSDNVQLSVIKGESVNNEESTNSETIEGKTIEKNLDDGAGSSEQN